MSQLRVDMERELSEQTKLFKIKTSKPQQLKDAERQIIQLKKEGVIARMKEQLNEAEIERLRRLMAEQQEQYN